MQTEAQMGRPPLPEAKKRSVRKVVLFTPGEWDEISEYLQQEGKGENELFREAILAKIRRK